MAMNGICGVAKLRAMNRYLNAYGVSIQEEGVGDAKKERGLRVEFAMFRKHGVFFANLRRRGPTQYGRENQSDCCSGVCNYSQFKR